MLIDNINMPMSLSLLSVLETQDKDMGMFAAGPWQSFGVTEDTVQIAVTQQVDQKTVVDGEMIH